MNIIDICILVYLAVATFAGFRRGLALSLASIAGGIGGLIIGYKFAGPAAAWLEATYGWTTRIAGALGGYLKTALPATAAPAQTLTPQIVKQALASSLIPKAVSDYLSNGLSGGTARLSQATSVADAIATAIASLLVTVVVFWLIYQACRIVAYFIGHSLTRVARHTPLNIPNHLGGGAIGLAEGVIGATLIIGLLSLIIPALPGGTIAATFASSTLVKLFTNIFYSLLPAAFATLGLRGG